jgi:hypothetical protein
MFVFLLSLCTASAKHQGHSLSESVATYITLVPLLQVHIPHYLYIGKALIWHTYFSASMKLSSLHQHMSHFIESLAVSDLSLQ